MRKVAVAVAVAIGLLSFTVSADSGLDIVSKTGDGTWTDNTWQVQMFPGEEKATTLKLCNGGKAAVAVFPSSLDNGNLTFELDKSSLTMPADVTLSARASSGTAPGVYSTELEIKLQEEVSPQGAPPGEIPPAEPTNWLLIIGGILAGMVVMVSGFLFFLSWKSGKEEL